MLNTYLELCQQLIEDAGISGSMLTVTDQTGEFKRVTNWVRRAVTELEQKYFDWNFLHNFYSFPTIDAQQDYPAPTFLQLDVTTGAVIGATVTGSTSGATGVIRVIRTDVVGIYVDIVVGIFEVGETFTGPEIGFIQKINYINLWDTTVFRITVDEQILEFEDWNTKKLDATIYTPGSPYSFTILPDKSIRLYDIPNPTIVTIGCAYWQSSSNLILNGDEPSIPTQFRDIIVYKALMYYANYESSDETKLFAIEAFDPLWDQLKASELPGFQSTSARSTGFDIQVQVPFENSYNDFY